MKVKLLLLEGSHEVIITHRIILLLNIYNFITPTKQGIRNYEQDFPECFGDNKINLKSFYNARINARNYNTKGIFYDIAPYFYFNQNNSTLLITWNYNGKNNKQEINAIFNTIESLVFDVSRFDNAEIESFSVFIHTDSDDDIEVSKNEFIYQFTNKDVLNVGGNLNEKAANTHIYTDSLKLNSKYSCFQFVADAPVSLFLLTTDPVATSGNLDSIVKDLLSRNENYELINQMVDKETYRERNNKKSVIGALGQEFEPGSSNAVILSNIQFISDEQIRESMLFEIINSFVN